MTTEVEQTACIFNPPKTTNILDHMEVDKAKASKSDNKHTMESMDKGAVENTATTMTPVKATIKEKDGSMDQGLDASGAGAKELVESTAKAVASDTKRTAALKKLR